MSQPRTPTAKSPSNPRPGVSGPKYPKLSYEICAVNQDYNNPLTMEKAIALLGWETEEQYVESELAGMSEKQRQTASVEFGGDYLLRDKYKNKVRCKHNNRNRPFKMWWCEQLCHDILRGHWRLNGEAIVIGVNGVVISGQHRLVALILACQEWKLKPERWQSKPSVWTKVEPYLETFITYGVDESPDTTRTIDNVLPRSLSDVLFTDVQLFGKMSPGARQKLCKMAEIALKTIWMRSWQHKDSFAKNLTSAEALDWIDRHGGPNGYFLQAVSHIAKEYKGKDNNMWRANAQRLNPGLAAGMMWLMGASATDGDDYRRPILASEAEISYDNWEDAKKFWSYVCNADKHSEMLPVVKALAWLDEPDSEGNPRHGTKDEKLTVFAKAWNKWMAGEKMTPAVLRPEYTPDQDGHMKFTDPTSVGGVDQGPPPERRRAPTDEDGEGDEPKEDSPEILEQRKKQEDLRRAAAERGDKAVKNKRRGKTVEEDEEQESPQDEEPGENDEVEDVDESEEADEAEVEEPPPEEKSFEEELADLKSQYPNQLLLLKRGANWGAWGEDARALCGTLKIPMRQVMGLYLCEFPDGKLNASLKKLIESGRRVVLLEEDENGDLVGTPAEKPEEEAEEPPTETEVVEAEENLEDVNGEPEEEKKPKPRRTAKARGDQTTARSRR